MQRPSILQLEQAFVEAWPALETRQDGGWIWRYANGYTKRANSAQCMDPMDEEDVCERVQRFAAWARDHGIVPTFRVTPLAGEKVVAGLNTLDWQPFEQSVVMAMPVGAAFTPKHETLLVDAKSAFWIDTQAHLSGYEPAEMASVKNIIDRMAAPVMGVLALDEEGGPAAAALARNNAGIGIYLNVVSRESARGLGYGRSVMQAALNWSRDEGAHWAAIQVVADNVPAINLYRSLGFSEVYRYHYRRPA